MNSFPFLSLSFLGALSRRPGRSALRFAIAPVLAIAVSPLAHADLGGVPNLPASSQMSSAAVKTLQAHTGTIALAAVTTSTSSTASTYTVRQTTSADGMVEREYLNVDQTVFAAVFDGPFIPNMQSLFGSSVFTQYASARTAQMASDAASGIASSRGRPINVSTGNLVVQITGHPGAFTGRAWIPTLVPSGMDTADIK